MTIIVLNGEATTIDSDGGTTVQTLLTSMDLTNKRLAVEVNQQIIPRGDFSSYLLKEQDKVEIVQAIGGGSYLQNKNLPLIMLI